MNDGICTAPDLGRNWRILLDINSVKIDSSWKQVIGEEFSKPYMADLKSFLVDELRQGKTIYPEGSEYFNALNPHSFRQSKSSDSRPRSLSRPLTGPTACVSP